MTPPPREQRRPRTSPAPENSQLVDSRCSVPRRAGAKHGHTLLNAAGARAALRPLSAPSLGAVVKAEEGARLRRAATAQRRGRVSSLTGLWRKDWAASESMARARGLLPYSPSHGSAG